MPTRKFKIKSGDIRTQKLEINDRGDTEAKEKYVIIWEIKSGSNVTSITSIDLKTPPNSEIFKSLEATDSPENKRWKGVVKNGATPGDYLYSIFWNTTPPALLPYKHDPKIAIKPPDFHLEIVQIILMVVGLISFYKIFSHKKVKNRYRKKG